MTRWSRIAEREALRGRLWEDFITEQDAEVLGAFDYSATSGLGETPAVVVVDVTPEFVGNPHLPVLDSMRVWPTSCGANALRPVRRIQQLVEAARAFRMPVVHVLGRRHERPGSTEPWRADEPRVTSVDDGGADPGRGSMTVPPAMGSARPPTAVEVPIPPAPGEHVVYKKAFSAFFESGLDPLLRAERIDSLIVCGAATSGCVRATVVDGASHGYGMSVVSDGTFDRSAASYSVSLFDMEMKYADVLTVAEVIDWWSSQGPGASRESATRSPRSVGGWSPA